MKKKKTFLANWFTTDSEYAAIFLLRQSFEQSMNSGFETVNEFVVFFAV